MKDSITLTAVGDIYLGDSVLHRTTENESCMPFAHVNDILSTGDVVFGNLESPCTDQSTALNDKCCLRFSPEIIRSLPDAGFNVLSLANNHIFDYDDTGYKDTLHYLDKYNIAYFGAGLNLNEAKSPLIIRKNNLSVGFLGYAWDFIQSINASYNTYGTAPLNKKQILQDVSDLKAKNDIVVVSLHWGYERERYPLPSQRILAHNIIDAGASIILGHHPHVLQGIEEYNNKIIVYSLGNFIFPDIHYKNYNIIQKDENKHSVIIKCTVSGSCVSDIKITPIIHCDTQPILAQDNSMSDILQEVEILSLAFGEKNYRSFWKKNKVRQNIPDVYGNPYNLMLYKGKKKLKQLITQVHKTLRKIK